MIETKFHYEKQFCSSVLKRFLPAPQTIGHFLYQGFALRLYRKMFTGKELNSATALTSAEILCMLSLFFLMIAITKRNIDIYCTLFCHGTNDRKRLMVVAAFIAEMSSDKSAHRNYKEMVKGGGIVDTLCDNLAGVAMVGSYPELASQIKPGGFQVTASYCAEVSKRAIEMLKLKGFVVENGVPENITVDRQNRLITLCMDALTEIRRYARAAFFDDLDYYNSNYASAFRQESGDTADEPEEELETMENVKRKLVRDEGGKNAHPTSFLIPHPSQKLCPGQISPNYNLPCRIKNVPCSINGFLATIFLFTNA